MNLLGRGAIGEERGGKNTLPALQNVRGGAIQSSPFDLFGDGRGTNQTAAANGTLFQPFQSPSQANPQRPAQSSQAGQSGGLTAQDLSFFEGL